MEEYFMAEIPLITTLKDKTTLRLLAEPSAKPEITIPILILQLSHPEQKRIECNLNCIPIAEHS